MFKKLSTDAYFKIIQKNHQHYLEANIVTHLGLDQSKQNSTLSRYRECINDYQDLIKRDLNEAMDDISTKEKIKGGALTTLLGAGIAGLAFTKTQSMPSADILEQKLLLKVALQHSSEQAAVP